MHSPTSLGYRQNEECLSEPWRQHRSKASERRRERARAGTALLAREGWEAGLAVQARCALERHAEPGGRWGGAASPACGGALAGSVGAGEQGWRCEPGLRRRPRRRRGGGRVGAALRDRPPAAPSLAARVRASRGGAPSPAGGGVAEEQGRRRAARPAAAYDEALGPRGRTGFA